MVSVVVPCHNCASFIKRAVSSVLNQTYQDLEIILVENNSSDNTLAILQEYQDLLPGKVRVEREYKRGAPAARNLGLFAAKGEWIQFLDADDELLPDKIEKQLSKGTREGSDVVAGSCLVEITEGKKTYRIVRPVNKDAEPWRGLLTSALGITSSNLWRREKIIEVGGWNESLSSSQEYDLLFRLLMAESKISFDDALLTVIYKMNDSISKSTDDEKFSGILQNRINLRLRIKEYLKNTNRLTSIMSREADMYIYNELKTNYSRSPRYVEAFLKNNRLDVPLAKVLKTNARLALRQYLHIKV